jgi:hypothetical protein
MQRKTAILWLVLSLSLLMSACGTSNTASTGSTGSISGNWLIGLTDTADTKASITQSGSLLENNDAVTGSLIFTDSPCSGIGSVQGSVAGSAVSLTVNPTGTEINLTGTMGSDSSCGSKQACMGGTYTTLSMGCIAGKTIPSTGTWTATLISPLKGNITGSLISNKGSTYAVTGQVSQGANSGSSSTPLSGSLTFSAGFCYPAATIVGSISGTSLVMNLVDTDGTQIGQVMATSSLDGTSLAGTYQYLGEGSGTTPGCTSGGTGNVTLAIAGQ